MVFLRPHLKYCCFGHFCVIFLLVINFYTYLLSFQLITFWTVECANFKLLINLVIISRYVNSTIEIYLLDFGFFKSLLDFISKKSLKKSCFLLNFFWMLWPEFIGARHILSQLFVHVCRRCASPLGRLCGASRVWQPRQ